MMKPIQQIQKHLHAAGYDATLADLEGRDCSLCPLIVPFRPDGHGRELALFIEVMPVDADDEITVISFSLLYPYEIKGCEHVSEAIRVAFILNRFLPFGSHEFCEQTPAFHYRYNLVVPAGAVLSETVCTNTVDAIGLFTRRHGRFIGRVLAGDICCDELIDELEDSGVSIPPVFTKALAEAGQLP